MLKEGKGPRVEINYHTDTAQGPTAAPKDDKNKGTKKQAITADTAPFYALMWKRDHPDAYALMGRIAIDMKRRGIRLSIRYIIEKVRYTDYPSNWEKPEKPFKVNDTLAPSLARMLMDDFPKLEGEFELRKSKADKFFANE